MKKKKKIFIIAVIVFILLIGVLLTYKFLGKEGKLIELEYNEVMKKINNKEDFVLCIAQTTCSHCATYKPKLMTIAKEYKIDIYYTNVDLYSDDEEKEVKNYLTYKSTPTTIFIKKGEESTTSNRLVGDVGKDKILKKLKSNSFIN